MKKYIFIITLLFAGLCASQAQDGSLSYSSSPLPGAYWPIATGPSYLVGDGWTKVPAYPLSFTESLSEPVLLTSPKGIQYWVSIPTTPGKYPIAFYVPGGGDRPENPQNSTFFKQFIPTNKDKFICAAAVMPPGRTGWDFPVDASGTKAGAYIAKYIFDTYADQSNGKFHGGGWSAGASYNFWYECRSFLTTLTICAGLGDMNTIRAFGQYKIPGRHYHGTSDGAISITKVRYGVDQYGPAMVLIEIPGGSHSSAPALAYSTTENIALWYLSFNPPEEPVLINDPGKAWYYSESEKLIIFETVNGKKLKVTPD